MTFLRPFLAIYGAGIAGTFAWLFFTLSGTSACALGTQSCRIVVGLTGQLALVWPAYWGGRISGSAAMTPLVPIEVVAIAILVFFVVLLLAQAYTLIGRSSSQPASSRPATSSPATSSPATSTPVRNEPLFGTNEPNRRNQSRHSRWARGAQS